MNDPRKSDSSVVPGKASNKAGQTVAETLEGRGLAKGNAGEHGTLRTQSRDGVSNGLDRVREVARRDRKKRFTALLHHVTVDRLRGVFHGLHRKAAAGVDGVTWSQYAEDLEARLLDLHARLHRGAYRAKPSRRVHIPKTDGRLRPLGIAALEDKLVQGAVVEVLSAIYEGDFLGFSYGFRPGRGAQDALDALAMGIQTRKVDWVLDADIRSFFDRLDHGWLRKFLEHRIADRRILRLIQKWLHAGVMEGGVWKKTEEGTPQGATISPLLANVFLHYVFDLWIQQWRRRHARGEVIVVRYADDFAVGFQHRNDAEAFRRALAARLEHFSLELHPEKTRLLEFGRYARSCRRERGEKGKPETFDFLGLTHICGETRNRKFLVHRHTSRTRLRSKLRSVKIELMRRRHLSIPAQGQWLGSVVRGHFAYFAVPTNVRALGAFRVQVTRHWRRALSRRGQRCPVNWARMHQLAERWLPHARILHPWPNVRFDARTQGRSPVR
jgi:group II intron reverse transcriptase/maturase